MLLLDSMEDVEKNAQIYRGKDGVERFLKQMMKGKIYFRTQVIEHRTYETFGCG